MTDERTDLDIVVASVPEEVEDCYSTTCPNAAEWVAILSCGHANPYCDGCRKGIDAYSRAGSLACSATHQTNKVLRWEKK